MAYTIKGLAKANECATYDENGLALMWDYWYVCNTGGRKSIIGDFKSLNVSDRLAMLNYLRANYSHIREYILEKTILGK